MRIILVILMTFYLLFLCCPSLFRGRWIVHDIHTLLIAQFGCLRVKVAWYAIVLAVVYDVWSIASVENFELRVFVKLLQMTFFFCLSTNAAFALYWTISNLVSMVTTFFINRAFAKQQKKTVEGEAE